MRFPLLLVLGLLSTSVIASACPWCQRYGVKETVSIEAPDPGGKIFGATPPAERTRHYYIAAEPIEWEWAPSGENTSKPLPLPPDLVEFSRATKIRYVQYTDGSFTRRVLDTPRMGLTGPVLRGMVGEYLAVTFLNRGSQPLTMHPHGVRYDKDSEGAYTLPNPGRGAAVGPGAIFTYVWQLDEASGPEPDEPSSKCWLYHSHATGDEEINFGLAGFIVVTDPKRARPDGTPADVDREMALLFYNFDESPEDESLDPEMIDPVPPPRTALQALELREAKLRPSVNGRMFGNLPGLEMRVGERVRWYIASLGEDDGMHSAHWHGGRLRLNGRRFVDVVSLMPGETKIADLCPDNPGDWLVHCHVSEHMMGGMFAHYVVHPANAPAPPQPFLGLETQGDSLRWTKAELSLDFNARATHPAAVTLRGKATAYQGFYPRRNPVTVRLGQCTAPLQFTEPAVATAEGIRWKVIGANEQGVVLTDEVEFELTLDGPTWRQTLSEAGLHPTGRGQLDLPIEIEFGNARHTAPLALQVSHEGARVHAHLP